ncbi:MAG: hypothetical protein JSV68_24635 [Anaerolineaceae bacterium]|jgi:MFS superfamily sulfate permease-like transporter|nr:MAG: hypothetical protein JSV68_24635 [Anaerolineaceae bacterium]
MLTLLIGLISLALIIGLRYVAPRIPGALVLVIAGIIASNVLNLGDRGGGSRWRSSPGPASVGDSPTLIYHG